MSPGPGCPPGALISQSWSLSTSSLCDRDVCSTPRPAGCLAHVRLPSSLLEAPPATPFERPRLPSRSPTCRPGGPVSGCQWRVLGTRSHISSRLPGTRHSYSPGHRGDAGASGGHGRQGVRGTPPTESAQGAGPECARLLPRRLRSRAPAAETRPGRALPAHSAQRRRRRWPRQQGRGVRTARRRFLAPSRT